MSTIILAHVVTGLAGVVSGLVVAGGIFYGKSMAWFNAIFLSMTLAACATGFVFLPSEGVTSAQLVGFFVTFLVAVAAYARYVRQFEGSWKQVYAFALVGALFLNILITTTQSFIHIPILRALAPTEHSLLYVATKLSLLLLFIVVVFAAARRAGRS